MGKERTGKEDYIAIAKQPVRNVVFYHFGGRAAVIKEASFSVGINAHNRGRGLHRRINNHSGYINTAVFAGVVNKMTEKIVADLARKRNRNAELGKIHSRVGSTSAHNHRAAVDKLQSSRGRKIIYRLEHDIGCNRAYTKYLFHHNKLLLTWVLKRPL